MPGICIRKVEVVGKFISLPVDPQFADIFVEQKRVGLGLTHIEIDQDYARITMDHQMPGGSTVVDAYRKLPASLICNLPVELCQIPVCYAPAKRRVRVNECSYIYDEVFWDTKPFRVEYTLA